MTFLPVQAEVNAADHRAFWLWSAVRPQPVLAQAESLYILQGQISERRGQTSLFLKVSARRACGMAKSG
jgi:hypothetical protein